MKMRWKDKEDLQDVLMRLDHLAYEKSAVDTIMPGGMILQWLLHALPKKYHMEKGMFKDESLETESLVTRTSAAFHF